MAGAKGRALEWALALLRAPGERHALRQRALPGGVTELLTVASEPDDAALAATAARWGEPVERLREAARFYAREILFHPQADAYRVLGLPADASAERIKAHHRLLQRWLHPDRAHAQDDAVFASRVNTAWNHLRSPERRQQYDAARAGDRVPEVIDTGERALRMGGWRVDMADVPPPAPVWQRRAPVYALLLACLVLVWLGVRDAASPPELAGWDADDEPRETIAALRVPEAKDTAAPAIAIASERPRRPSAPRSTPRRQPTPSPTAEAVATAPRAAIEPMTAPGAAGIAPEQAAPPRERPAPRPLAREAATATTMADPAPVLPEAPAQAEPRMTATPRAASVAIAPAALAAPAPAAPAAPIPDDDAQQAFARAQQARDVGDQLVRYMAGTGGIAPPIWNSPAIQSSADLLRQDLHAEGRVRLGRPQWRIGSRGASLTVPAGSERRGRVTADLVFREGRWLVTGLSVEQGS